MECSEPGCDRPADSRGLCRAHYTYQRRKGLLGTQCPIEGCDRAVYAKGLCDLHYSQQLRPGAPHYCLDCGVLLVRKPGNGKWPERCPDHQREHINAQQRTKHRQQAAKRKAQPKFCKEPGCDAVVVPPLRLCPEHQLCSIEGCDQPKKDGSLCGGHRTAARKVRVAAAGLVCSLDGCDQPMWSKDLCRMHYNRLLKDGDVGPVERLAAPKAERRVSPDGYVFINLPGQGSKAEHRMVMEQMLGRPLLPGETPHHRNGIRDDNRPENLELWVRPQVPGQRAADLVAFVCDYYPEIVRAQLKSRGKSNGQLPLPFRRSTE